MLRSGYRQRCRLRKEGVRGPRINGFHRAFCSTMPSSKLIALFAAALLGQVSASATNPLWRRVLLPATGPAKCLDGTPGGYWISEGAEKLKFLVHLQGGGWCTSFADCAARSLTPLGSSATWKVNETTLADGGNHGMLNRAPDLNPQFHNWTMVYVGYCDGGSFAGFVDHSILVQNTTRIFFRGRSILNTIMEELLHAHGADGATDFVLKGTSAGGLAVMLHADRVGAMLPPTTKFRAIPGAGFFMGTEKSLNGSLLYLSKYIWTFKAMNASGGVNENCLMGMPSGYLFRCFLAPFAAPYVQTPSFYVNALQDAWQAKNILGVSAGCDPVNASTCTAAELAGLTRLSQSISNSLNEPLSNAANGAFLPQCFTHCLENTDEGLHKLAINGTTMATAIADWYAGTRTRIIDGPSLNPTCPTSFCGESKRR